MSRIKSRDTNPEKIVRSLIFKLGYRYRLHDKKLPGKPDIVFRKAKKTIFVHGCFWHLHKGCRDGTIPKTDHQRWKAKLERNVERDRTHVKELKKDGWKVLVLWERDIERRRDTITKKLKVFLSQQNNP